MKRIGQYQRRRACFVRFAMWRHRKRSLSSLTASRSRLKFLFSNFCYCILTAQFELNLLLGLYNCQQLNINKMQSKTADFAPGATTWEHDQKIRVVFHSCRFAPSRKHDVIPKPEVHNVRNNRTTVTSRPNMYRKFGKIWMCGLWYMRADRQTDRQTYIHTGWSKYSAPLTGAK